MNIAQKTLIGAIKLYQTLFSAEKGLFSTRKTPVCPYTPPCSEYAIAAIRESGAALGTIAAINRLLRCRKGVNPAYDPPPRPKSSKRF